MTYQALYPLGDVGNSGLTQFRCEATRTLSGTPTTVTVSPVSLTYTATQGSETARPRMFTITVIAADAPLALAVVANRSYTVGTAITDLALSEAAGGTDGTVIYALTGDLPEGLSFNASTRTLSGTPTAATAAVTLTYTATQGSATARLPDLHDNGQ